MSKFYRCTLQWRKNDATLFGQNVLCMEDASETMPLATIGQIMDEQWWGLAAGNALRLWTTNVVRLETVFIQRLDVTPSPASFPYTARGAVGNSSFNVKHPVLGFCFRLFDGGGGPRHRGRVYHYGTRSDWLSDAGPDNATLTTQIAALRDIWLNAFGPLPTSGLHWNLFHRDLSGAARFTRVTDIRLSPRLVVQRRRNFGVGM